MDRRWALAAFHASHAARIVGWVTSAAEARAWCGHAGASLPTPGVFARWHADPDVHPHVLLRDGTPAAYGELWVDGAADETELARLIVDPAHRGRGVGRRLVEALLREAATFAPRKAFVRVAPDNAPALACYRGAGFRRVTPAEEERWNAAQPQAYVWLRRRVGEGGAGGGT